MEKQANYATRGKTIFRVKKNADNPFVMIDRRPIENPKLSWKAKGILAYLLSRPDNWVVRLGDLVKHSPDGAFSVRGAIKELRNAGHITYQVDRENGHIKQWILIVHEIPLLRGNQQVENQQVENLMLNNNDLNETDLTNIGADAPSLALPLDWQIAIGGKIIPLSEDGDFLARARDSASLMDFQCPGAGKLAEAFMLARRIIIPQNKVKGNRKAAREMIEQGVRPEHVTQATEELINKRMTVVDLFSVSKTAIDLANKPKEPELPHPEYQIIHADAEPKRNPRPANVPRPVIRPMRGTQ